MGVLVFVQEEDTEEEPKLKYERLTNGVTEILQKDAASCMTVHDKVLRTLLISFLARHDVHIQFVLMYFR